MSKLKTMVNSFVLVSGKIYKIIFKNFFIEFLKSFLSKEKSDKVEQPNLSFPDQIKKLTDALELISSELKQKIRHDYPSLLKHSSNATK